MPEEVFKTDANGLVRLGPSERGIEDILTSNEILAVVYLQDQKTKEIKIGAINYGYAFYKGITQIETGSPPYFACHLAVHIDKPTFKEFEGIKKGTIIQYTKKLDCKTSVLDSDNTEFFFFRGTAEDMIKKLVDGGYRINGRI